MKILEAPSVNWQETHSVGQGQTTVYQHSGGWPKTWHWPVPRAMCCLFWTRYEQEMGDVKSMTAGSKNKWSHTWFYVIWCKNCRRQTCTTFLISVFFNSIWGTKAKKGYWLIIKNRTHHFTKRCSPSGILLTCSVETLFWRQYNICPGSVCHPWLNPASLACRPCTTSMLNFPTSRNRRAPFYTRV